MKDLKDVRANFKIPLSNFGRTAAFALESSRRFWLSSLICMTLAASYLPAQVPQQDTSNPAVNDELASALEQHDLPRAQGLWISVKMSHKNMQPFVARVTSIADKMWDEGQEEAAIQWYRFAAEQGGDAAQVSLGITLQDKSRKHRNDQEAVKWLQLAAGRFDPWAYAALVEMYEEGRGGLPKSPEKAAELNRLAADALIGPAIRRMSKSDSDETEAQANSLNNAIERNDLNLIRKFNLEELNAAGDTPLLSAVRRGKPQQVQLLLSMGALRNTPNKKGERPLLMAADNCDSLSTQYLLSAGADPNLSSSDGRLPLHAALIHGCEELIPMLLQAHADVNVAGIEDEFTALHFAVIGLNPEGMNSASGLLLKSLLRDSSRRKAIGIHVFESILEKTKTVDATGKTGLTPLMVAVDLAGRTHQMQAPGEDNLLKAITLLLSKGANANAVNADGDTPLILATQSDCAACVDILVGNGGQISHRNNYGSTAIGAGLRSRVMIRTDIDWPGPGLDTLRALLRAGASLTGEDSLGLAPISYAMWESASIQRNATLLNDLLKISGSSEALLRRIESERNQIALFAAAGLGESSKLRALIAKGVSVNARTPEGVTPLAFAVLQGNDEIIDLLLKSGADASISSEIGITPLMLAARRQQVNVVGDLLRAHADAASRDAWGETALHFAIPPKHTDWRTYNPRNAERERYINLTTSLVRVPWESSGLKADSGAVKEIEDRSVLARREPAEPRARAIEVAELLVKADAPTDAVAANGLSPLEMACDSEQWDLSYLLAQYAKRDVSPGCHLLALVAKGTPEQISSYVEHWPSGENIDPSSGASALILSIILDHPDAFDILLRSGVDSNAQNRNGQSPLNVAVSEQKIEFVRKLIEAGASVQVREAGQPRERYPENSNRKGTPLYFAVDVNSAEIAKALLDAGADPNAFTTEGKTPLMTAAEDLHVEMVELLLDNGADVTARDSDKSTALGHAFATNPSDSAAQSSQMTLLKILLKAGSEIDPATGFHGGTPLTQSVQWGRNDLFHFLIDSGANVNAESSDGLTPLIAAANNNRLDFARVLIHRGAKLEPEYEPGGFEVPGTALVQAIAGSNREVALLLIQAGANVNHLNSSGRSPLMLAAINRDAVVTRALLAKGAAVDGGGSGEETPAFLAVMNASRDVLQVLLDNGAPLEGTDNEGNSLLLRLAASTVEVDVDLAIAKLLIARGIKIDAVNLDGETALHLAAGNGLTRLCHILVDHGASIQLRDPSGRTALFHAALAQVWDSKKMDFPPQMEAALLHLLIPTADAINAQDKDGQTALMLAAWNGKMLGVDALLNLGANPNLSTSDGQTALLLALNPNTESHTSGEAQATIVSHLINHGADVNQHSVDGNSPLIQAVFSGLDNAVLALLQRHCKVNEQNSEGYSALMYAAAQGRADYAKLLMKYGADNKLKSKDGLTAALIAKKNAHPDVATLIDAVR